MIEAILAVKVYTTAFRVYPLTWHGPGIGLRMELMGCNPLCKDIFCSIYTKNDITLFLIDIIPAYKIHRVFKKL